MVTKTLFSYFMLDVALIVMVARIGGWASQKLRQPAVIGEIAAGIALGPSLLGLVPGHLDAHIFPAEVLPYLKNLAQLGLVLFMFIVGLELDIGLIRGRRARVVTISSFSIIVPFACGMVLALYLHPLHDVVDGRFVPMLHFMLFMGVALSITALPVLARILTDRQVNRTSIGATALSAAAIADVFAWILLAIAYAVISDNGWVSVVRTIALLLAFLVLMFAIVRPILDRVIDSYRRIGSVTPNVLVVMLVGALVSAWATERIGVHEIFGAFMFGVIMPTDAHARKLRYAIITRLKDLNNLLLLPIFFVVAGFEVDIPSFTGSGTIWQLVLIFAVATLSKFGGAFCGARIQHVSPRHSVVIATLMNTRGLTELIVLLIGVQIGVLDTAIFSMMVVMALLTTALTTPIVRTVYPDDEVQRDIDAAERARTVR